MEFWNGQHDTEVDLWLLFYFYLLSLTFLYVHRMLMEMECFHFLNFLIWLMHLEINWLLRRFNVLLFISLTLLPSKVLPWYKTAHKLFSCYLPERRAFQNSRWEWGWSSNCGWVGNPNCKWKWNVGIMKFRLSGILQAF